MAHIHQARMIIIGNREKRIKEHKQALRDHLVENGSARIIDKYESIKFLSRFSPRCLYYCLYHYGGIIIRHAVK